MIHPNEDELRRYVTGEMADADCGPMVAHLVECPECRQREHDLSQGCYGDLRAALRDEERASDVHAPPPGISLPTEAVPLPDQIAGYHIVRLIAEGGMGVVYEAEQDQPHRRVALKMIRSGHMTRRLRKRFEVEVEVLGRLQHPGIAQIYDAGVHDAGHGPQPYFAMEYVEGATLMTFAHDAHLNVRDRLALFARVVDAVDHAHGKFVIHRDLKPSNILVTAEGQPKVLDFGVARATDSDFQLTTAHSDVGQLLGTLPYMSPEQTACDPGQLDARSDVYSLGVLLFELLTGSLPIDLRNRSVYEAIRMLKEEEAPRLSSIARTLKGDVDTMVRKCLEKNPAARYESAHALAADLRRYLNDEPIWGRPPSTTYQLGKFARRHKGLVAGVALAFVVLLAGIGVTGHLLLRERQARLAEQHERALRAEKETIARNQLRTQLSDAALMLDADGIDALLAKSAEVGISETEYLTYLGFAHTIRLDWQEALSDENRAIELDPHNALALYLRALNNAYHGNVLSALADYASAQRYGVDSDEQLTGRGVVNLFVGREHEALKNFDELANRMRGRPAGVWMRGFGRWFVLLMGTHGDLDERWQLAESSLSDMDAAAKLYSGQIPFILDARADLLLRMALICAVRGDQAAHDAYLKRVHSDAEELVSTGAAGAGYLHLAALSMYAHDLPQALEQLKQADADLARGTRGRSFNAIEAQGISAQLRLWCSLLCQPPGETRALLVEVGQRLPDVRASFGYGCVSAALGMPMDAAIADAGGIQSSFESGVFGYWVGDRLRGDAAAAEQAAQLMRAKTNTLTSAALASFSHEHKWRGLLVQQMCGEDCIDALTAASAADATVHNRFELIRALQTDDPAERAAHLQAIADGAHPDLAWVVAVGLQSVDPDVLSAKLHEPVAGREAE